MGHYQVGLLRKRIKVAVPMAAMTRDDHDEFTKSLVRSKKHSDQVVEWEGLLSAWEVDPLGAAVNPFEPTQKGMFQCVLQAYTANLDISPVVQRNPCSSCSGRRTRVDEECWSQYGFGPHFGQPNDCSWY